jgi:hypothetical protein
VRLSCLASGDITPKRDPERRQPRPRPAEDSNQPTLSGHLGMLTAAGPDAVPAVTGHVLTHPVLGDLTPTTATLVLPPTAGPGEYPASPTRVTRPLTQLSMTIWLIESK